VMLPEEGILFTGIPARFDFNSTQSVFTFNEMIRKFRKVRMIGAASISLLQVAKGAGDAYFEDDIMLWDVAAGISIVEGAGGTVSFFSKIQKYSLQVKASNSSLIEQF
jgi:myo-inositol-1(or 4)-monophosphatase